MAPYSTVVCAEAILHGVETRTSAPVQITRHADSLECVSVQGLFPAGEGAGYAGGIVSAAVDGMKIAQKLIDRQTRVRPLAREKGGVASTS